MSNRTVQLAAAAVIALLALPAAADSWPKIAQRQAMPKAPAATASQTAAPVRSTQAKSDGFEYVGGEPGWQLTQHKYVWNAGRFAHSDECDHAIRTAKGPTPAELETARKNYGGG